MKTTKAKGKKGPGMRHSKVPWVAKLRPEMHPHVGKDPKSGRSLLIPSPLAVAEEIAKVPAGKLTTPGRIRARLAAKYKTELTCPLCTGIFFNIVAGAAEEQLEKGEQPVAPYWRVVLENGRLSEKTPPGPAQQAKRLRAEGVRVTGSGEKFKVEAWEELAGEGQGCRRKDEG